MNKVRWGLLSTAHINRQVIPAIRQSKRAELSAVASRELARARSYAQRWDIPNAFGSYSSMLESGKIDAVYISLPNHLHAEWTVRALDAGIHVLCEKPFAISINEVDRMIAASRKNDRRLAEAFMYRHHPQTRAIGEWVHSGRLGQVTLVRGNFNFKIDDRHGNVRLFPADQGGGCLWDVGVYPLSMAQFIYGQAPEKVYGQQWLGPSGVDETFAGQMSYPGSGLAQISSGFRSPFYTQVEILGTGGNLTVTSPFTKVEESRLTFQPVDGDVQPIAFPHQDLYLGEIEDMQSAILDGAPNYLTLEETRNHIRTVLALYDSARRNAPVRLD